MNKANCKTVLLMIAATFWLATVLDWRGDKFLPFALHTTIFVFAFGLATCAFWPVRRLRLADPVLFWRRATALYITSWQLSVFVTYTLVWDALRSTLARGGLFGLFFIGLLWTIWLLEKFSQKFESDRYVPLNTDALLAAKQQRGAVVRPPKIWHPLDPAAWYYGRANPRLRQSLAGFATYAGVFLLLCIIASRMQGCYEIYEMPAGGGEQKTVAQVVRVQKVIRKKFIVNPFSAIIFETPPIDDVKLQLDEVTEHTYTPGYGEGKGAGFAGGTKRGKVRFIRLEYSGGDWEQDYGIGGDLNMLVKYYELTTHPVANRTESRRVAQLKNFPATKSPPFVYLTGQKNISFSNNDVKTLREYLVDKHGMLFIDNGGSRHFHNQVLSTMNRVLPDVRPVPVPLDDVIHRVPFRIPFLPYVAPHGGKEALGWYKDGRWVCYYHPGDIGDAWSDGHAGVSAEITDACYQLGANVIFYAHSEYAKWLEAQKKE